MILLVMAAGSGSRYGKLKQFDSLGPCGEFLMEFSIYDAIQNGFDQIVIITKKETQEFLKDHLSKKLNGSIKLDVIAQEINDMPKNYSCSKSRTKPWGTAHAVWTARNVIDKPFLVINADDYYGQEAFKTASNFINKKKNEMFALVGYQLKKTLSDFGSVSRGVCQIKNNFLDSIIERTKIRQIDGYIIDETTKTKLNPNEIVSMNYWICTPKIFQYIEKYFILFLNDIENHEKNEIYLPFVIQEMIDEKIISVQIIESSCKWFGITYSEDKKNAMKILSDLSTKNKYPSPLWIRT